MAVAANQTTAMRNPTNRISVPSAAAVHHYEGTLAFAIAASGYADVDDAAGVNAFIGVVAEECDNSAGAAGDESVELYTEGEFDLAGTGFTQALVGDKAYATDNYTVTPTSTSATLIGRFTEFLSATRMRVKIEIGTQA